MNSLTKTAMNTSNIYRSLTKLSNTRLLFRTTIDKTIFSPFTMQAMRLSTTKPPEKSNEIEDLKKQIKSLEKKITDFHNENVSFFEDIERRSNLRMQDIEKQSKFRKQDIQETIALYFFLNILFTATIGHYIY
jgi:hypothetical protein